MTEAVRLQGALEGWQAILFSEANWLLFNVPAGPGGFEQHVMNVQTGAWCKFSGMKAHCWETFKGNLYFGADDGEVHQANSGGTDNDTSIRGVVRSAYNYLRSSYDKQFSCSEVISSRHLQELRYQLAHLLISIEDCLASRQDCDSGRDPLGHGCMGHFPVVVRPSEASFMERDRSEGCCNQRSSGELFSKRANQPVFVRRGILIR